MTHIFKTYSLFTNSMFSKIKADLETLSDEAMRSKTLKFSIFQANHYSIERILSISLQFPLLSPDIFVTMYPIPFLSSLGYLH